VLNSRIGAGLGKIFGMNRGESDARVTYFLNSTDISYVSLFIYCYCWYLIRPSIYNRGTSKYFSKLTERTLFLVVSRRLFVIHVNVEERGRFERTTTIQGVSTALCDIIISGALCLILDTHRSGMKRWFNASFVANLAKEICVDVGPTR